MKHKGMITTKLIHTKQKKNCDEIFLNLYRCSYFIVLMQIGCEFFLIDSLDNHLQLYEDKIILEGEDEDGEYEK